MSGECEICGEHTQEWFCDKCIVPEPIRSYDLPKINQWIKCSDRLPQEGEKVLSYSQFEEEIRIDYLIYCPEAIWAYRLFRDETKITHWMPLPMPPKE